MAGSIAEASAGRPWRKDFRHIDPTTARIVLVEAAARAAPVSIRAVEAALPIRSRRLGVEGDSAAVTEIDPRRHARWRKATAGAHLDLGRRRVPPPPAARWLGAESDRAGRVILGPDLTLPGHDEYLSSAIRPFDGRASPCRGSRRLRSSRAPMSRRGPARLAGAAAGAVPLSRLRQRWLIIGRREAIADFGWLQLRGRLGWFAWGLVHIYFLIGFPESPDRGA